MVKTPNRKRRLSSALIMETALSLAEQCGADALTVRRLGEELGADPTALYRHFGSKEELLMALVDYLITRAVESMAPTERWQDGIAEGARRTVAIFLRYPAIAAAIGAVLTRRDSDPANVETVLALLAEAGLPDDLALLEYRTWVDFLLAYAAQRALNLSVTEEQRRADAQEWSRRREAVDPEEFPTVARIGAGLYDVSDDAILENWLRMFIGDVERLAAAGRV